MSAPANIKQQKVSNPRDNLPYLIVRLGTKCNAGCLFCNVPREDYPLEGEVSLSKIKKEIKALIGEKKRVKISLSGGEPTTRKDLPEIIRFTKQSGAKVVEIQTNAILLDDANYVKKLRKSGLDKAFVSFHSHIPRIQDAMLNRKGVYERCLKGIKNSLHEGIEVNLNPVITTKSYKYLPDYISFVKKNLPGVYSISLSVVQPHGRAWKNSKLVPRYKTIDSYIRRALELGKKLGIVINNPYCGLPLCIGGWQDYLDLCMEFSENYINVVLGEKTKNSVFSKESKVKSRRCLLCDLFDFCNGAWRKYAELYTLTDLKPVKLQKNKLKLYT